MRELGLGAIILGVIVLIISVLADSVSNVMLLIGGLLVVAGLLFYIIFNRYS